jgi:hypothetical protein
MSRKNTVINLKQGQEIFEFAQKNPTFTNAAIARKFKCNAHTVGRIKAGTWRPVTLGKIAQPAAGKAYLVKPGTTGRSGVHSAVTSTLPADQFTVLTGELNTALGLLAETAGKMGFEAVVHFKGK